MSTSLAAVCSRKLKLPFVPLATLLIAVNHIDLDHLLYYYLDDGTANSLTLHPLHIYGGVLICVLSLCAILSEKYSPWCLALIGSISLHFAADTLAYVVRYQIPWLLFFGIVNLIFFTYLMHRWVRGNLIWLLLFFYFNWGLHNGVAAFIHFTLHINPQLSRIPYIVPNVLAAFTYISFYFLFRNRIYLRGKPGVLVDPKSQGYEAIRER